MINSVKTRRLFFALWPSDRVRQSILKQYSRIPGYSSGRVMPLQNLHITLIFLGQVTAQVKDCMHDAARVIRSETFQLELDCYGYFHRARIFWMGSQRVPVELVRLHASLDAAIENCGFRLESRPYVPHLTLMRKCSDSKIPSECADFSISWPVDSFALVESIPIDGGVNYQLIEKYPLS